MFRYAVTIFVSAFLLFQVQPLIGKFILPWFGGTPAVWTTCMLFFQSALLAGYSYAHFLSSRVSPRGQMLTHLGLLIASVAFLPIIPDPKWKPAGEGMPIGEILLLLSVTIGLPYFMLSTTGPLMQESYRRETGHPPYRLYALSNFGSLLALLSYPFVFEPELKLNTQIWGWSVGYCVFAVFCGWCALGFIKPAKHVKSVPESISSSATAVNVGDPTWRDILLWLALAACGSSMLLATTNQLCQEVSAVPFLWVLPLSLYLTTFIICFDHERWYHRGVFLVLLAVAVLGACYAVHEGTSLKMWQQLAIYCSAMWVCCMVCHGELVRHKPAPHHATLFYLMVSLGGVIGGLLVAVVAPLVLRDFWEYQITLVATILLAFFATARRASSGPRASTAQWVAGGGISVALGLTLGWAAGAYRGDATDDKVNLETARNFYGVLHVNHKEYPGDEGGSINELIHGRIQHGIQYTDADKHNWITTYYAKQSGIGLAIEQHPRRSEPMKIGVVGLGTGTLAAYARPGDTVRFYEINPEVLNISDRFFTYRKDAQDNGANVEVVLGDARIKMDRETDETDRQHFDPQRFDVLAVDAFSSDAIPMHLLTVECARIFQKELKPDGILALHVSNQFLDLTPVVRGLAEQLGCECVLIESDSDPELGINHSSWALLTTNWEFLNTPAVAAAIDAWDDSNPAPIVWTDDYTSLRKVLDLGLKRSWDHATAVVRKWFGGGQDVADD